MAQISYDAIPETATSGGNGNGVDFFGLRNDGDEALVRIMHDSVESFNIFAIHDRMSVGGKFRKINCIRDAREPVDNCPLCAAGNAVGYRMFINMVQYTKDQSGQTISKPVVWERSVSYANRLKSLIEEYGPLSDCLFKIKRNGAAGSMETTYDILFCNPKVYRDDLYPKACEDVFSQYSALGTIIMNKDFNELNTYLATGQFPAAQKNNAQTAAPANMSYEPKTANVAPPAAQYNTQVPQAPQYATTSIPETPPVLDNPPFDGPYNPVPAPQYGAPAPVSAPAYPAAPPAQPNTRTLGRPSPRYY